MFKEKNVVNNVDKSSLWTQQQNGTGRNVCQGSSVVRLPFMDICFYFICIFKCFGKAKNTNILRFFMHAHFK